MAQKVDTRTFLELAPQGVVIDVRTPAEFASGHIPGSCNLPLFTNEERAQVGTIYKKVGREQAIERGLELVGPRLAQIVSTAKDISQGRRVLLYCWRGGMRSGSVAWLLEMAGMAVTLLQGGYKAYRRSFDDLLAGEPWRLVVLSGATGSGKTELLQMLSAKGEQVLDLEGLARHKGSSFGGIGQGEQPTTEHFINLLHERFRRFSPSYTVLCEGESMLIGRVFIPPVLFEMMRNGTHVEITMDRESRLDRLVVEYGCLSSEELAAAFTRISKRMGREQATKAINMLNDGNIRDAASLALEYYDKTYAKNAAADCRHMELTADNNNMEESAKELKSLLRH